MQIQNFFSGEEGSEDYLSLSAMEWGTKGIFSIILLCSKKFRSAHACWTRHSFIINSFMWCRNRGVSIKQMHTFKIRFKMKCTSDDGMIRSLAISWIMYVHVPSRSVISLSTRHLPGMLRSHVAQILLCVSEKVFLHLQTVSYRMTVVGFFFLTHFLTRFPTIFTEVNDWLYVWNYVGLMFYVYIVWKILDVANQN